MMEFWAQPFTIQGIPEGNYERVFNITSLK